MKLFPWIQNRKLIVISLILDCIIIFFSSFLIDINSINSFSSRSFLEDLIICSLWSTLSYIVGRYDNKKYNFYTKKTKKIFREITFISTLSYISYLVINKIFKNLIFEKIFIKLFLISILCTLIQFILKFIFQNTVKEKRQIVWHIGKSENIDIVNFYIENTQVNCKTKILDFPDEFVNIPDEVIISDYKLTDKYKKNLVVLIKEQVPIRNINQWCESNLNIIPPELLNEIQPYSNIYSSYKSIGRRRLKRIGDIVVSLIILILSSPLLLLAAILIKIQDGGPIIYRQKRTGLWGNEIIIHKLRTMIKSAESKGSKWSTKNDKRITPIGKLLRKTRFDEIPQLLLVIRGVMSLIGPRPERPEFDKNLESVIKNYEIRYWVKPGLSGWAQVNYPYGASTKDARMKLSYDLFYINNISFLLDLLILTKTIFLVFGASGSEPKS